MFRRKSRADLLREAYEARLEASYHNRQKQEALKRLADHLKGSRGECVPGDHCALCEHRLTTIATVERSNDGLVPRHTHTCDLDVPCKSFTRTARKPKDKEGEKPK